MSEGYFHSIDAQERHKQGASRGGQQKRKKGFAVSGKASIAGRRSGVSRRKVSKEIRIIDPSLTQKVG